MLEALFVLMARAGDLKAEVIETIALALAAGVVYFIALYVLEHSAKSRTAFWIILAAAVLFRLTLYSLTPSLSTDIQRYRWDGRVQNEGWNPYALAPNDPRLGYLRDPGYAVMPGPEIPSMYPPLSQLVFRAGARFLPGTVAFKLPFVLAELLVLAMLAKWLQSYPDGNFRLAIYAWNPLVIVEFAASGHNDALTIAAMVAALAIIKKRPGASTRHFDCRLIGEALSGHSVAPGTASFGLAPKASRLASIRGLGAACGCLRLAVSFRAHAVPTDIRSLPGDLAKLQSQPLRRTAVVFRTRRVRRGDRRRRRARAGDLGRCSKY